MAIQPPESASSPARPAAEEPTIGKLVTDVSRDLSTLISKEVELAKSELKLSVRFGVAGVVFFAIAGFLGLLAIIMLSVAFAYLLHWNGDFLDLQWAFLVVFAVYLLLAGLFGLIGYRKVTKARPPERAIAQGREIPKNLRGKRS